MKKLWRYCLETVLTIILPERRRVTGSSLYANSIFLITNSVILAALGFAFWIIAARLYPTEAVGLGSALISAATLLAFIATLGLGSGLIRYLPTVKSNPVGLINSCFTLSGLTALIVALIFVAGISLWSPALSFIRSDLRFGVTFITFVIASTLFSLLADTYLALRRAEYALVQGSLMGLLKLGLVIILAGFFGIFGIIASWTVATLVMVGLGVFLFLARLRPDYRPALSLRRERSREMVNFSLANYIALGLWSTPGWVLPIIVLNQLGSQSNAHFFVGWSMCALLFAIPTAISNSLFAESSHQAMYMARDIKRSLKLIALLVLPATALLMLAADKLLLVFGQQYSQDGTRLIWILAPSTLPLSLNVLFLAIAKIRKRLNEVITLSAGIVLSTLSLTYVLLPRLGIMAPGVAWLASQTLVALILVPRFVKILGANTSVGVA